MFGVVPKTLWQRTNPSDDMNRIRMTSNCLLLTDGKVKIVLETGMGSKEGGKFENIYAVEGESIDKVLGARGIAAGEIDYVILSHLHFDHCGGAVRISGRGEYVPAFEKAIYFVQKKELEAALNSNERTRGSYLRHDFEPLQKAGQLRVLDGDSEIYPGISIFIAEGHTEGMQCTLVQSGDKKLFFSADLFPLEEHVSLPTIMSYDLFPLATLQTKKKILPRALREQWLMTFTHDPDIPFGYLEEKDGKIKVRPLELMKNQGSG